jgi:mono/diheme cytochrome c family protein
MPDPVRSLRVISLSVALQAACGLALADDINKQEFKQIEHGHYLTLVGDCAACHTLAGSGHDLAGGRAIETPFGELLAPNITPDPITGIGAWTDQEFVDAMKKGTGRDGTHLFPAMPYTYYTRVTRDDVLAIRAYLNTVPAVYNPVKADQLPFPFNIRASLIGWNAMFFTPGEFKPGPSKSAEWNRGAYLAEGLGHCGLCHTPKNFLGGDKNNERLRGYALQGWFAADITGDSRRGLGGWSVDDIVAYLKTGHGRNTIGTGPMAETIGYSTSHWADGDLKAIATYLKDAQGPASNDRQTAAPILADQSVMIIGAQIYADECSGCHSADGKSAGGPFSSLAGSSIVQQTDPASLIHIVLRGARGVATDQAPMAPGMPQFGWVLKDDEVAAVLTYIRNSWGNAAPAVTTGAVGNARSALVERSD